MSGQGNTAVDEGDRQFDWCALVPLLINPMKVTAIEALHYINRPLSASDLTKVLDREIHLSRVSYYLKALADAGVLTKVGERRVRGSVEKFYFFAPQE